MLGKFAHEVANDMSPEEFTHWIAFLKLREKEQKKNARKLARSKARRR